MTLPNNLKARLIREAELPYLATFLAGIFFDSRAYAIIFANLDTRMAGLEWLFYKNLLLQQATSYTWIVTEEAIDNITQANDLIATITVLPPNQKKGRVADYIKFGLLALPFKFGWGALRSLLKVNQFNEREIARAANGQPFFYLAMVATKKQYRGRGIASDLIKHLIAQQVTNYPILLTTQLQSNVNLYQKLGFEVVPTQPAEKQLYPNWAMKRP